MQTLTSFGKEVRKRRIDSAVTLGQMAEALGVSPAYLSAIEMGKRNLPLELLEKISIYFKLPPNEKVQLTRLAEASQKTVSINLSNANLQTREVIASFARNFTNLSREDIFKIKRILEPDDAK